MNPVFSLSGNSKVIGIGSPRASLEANFALSDLVGKNNFYHGISGKEYNLVKQALKLLENDFLRIQSLEDIEKCDAVLILGEDITNTAPMMALAIRQAIRNRSVKIAEKMNIPKWNDAAVRTLTPEVKSPVFIISPHITRLDDVAECTWHGAPQDIARLGFALASSLQGEAPAVTGQEKSFQEMAGKIAEIIKAAENPLIVTGISLGNSDILNAAENLAYSLYVLGKKPGIAIALPESNSAGLGMMDGRSLDDALERIENNMADTLIILENDLYRRVSPEKAGIALEKCTQVIVLDHLINETVKKADVVLPVATYAESSGTLVNYEGRAQRYYPVMPAVHPVKESWDWIGYMKRIAGDPESEWQTFDQVVSAMAMQYPVFSAVASELPRAGYRFFNEKIARQTMRFSGRTAILANISVSEPAPPDDPDSPLEFSMEGYKGFPSPPMVPYYWSPGWNSPQAINKYLEEPDGPLKNMEPGVMLLEAKNRQYRYNDFIPESFTGRRDELFFIPVYRIFGSEELSSNGRAIGERIPKPFVLINRMEAGKLGFKEKDSCNVALNQMRINVNIEIDESIPDGIAGLSFLLPGMPFAELPGWGKISGTGMV